MVRIAGNRRTPIVDPSIGAGIDLAQTIIGELDDWDTRIRNSEINNEINNANIAYMEGIGGIDQKKRDAANRPDLWVDITKNEKRFLKNSLLKGATYKESINSISSGFELKFADYLEETKAAADVQRMENNDTDYKVRRAKGDENRNSVTPLAVATEISLLIRDVNKSFESGVSELPTEATRDAEVERRTKLKAEQYILNTGEYTDNPNKFFDDIKLYDTRFTEEEISKIKKDHNSNKELAKTQAKIGMENAMADAGLRARQYSIDGDFGRAKEIINQAFNQIETLTDEEKTALTDWHTAALNKLQNANSILFSTGANVYNSTQNPVLYDQLRRRLALEKYISDLELMNSVGEDGISWPDFDELKKIRDGTGTKAKAFEDSAAGKNLKALIDDIIDEEDERPLNQFITEKGLGLLRDAITPEMTNREKKEEALRIARNLEQSYEAGTLDVELEEKVFGITRPENVPMGKSLGMESIWDKLDTVSKREALKALSQGYTAQQLIDHFNLDK